MTPAPTPFALDGRTIVVTGGYGQLGRAITLGLLQAGAAVAVLEPAPSDDKTAAFFGAHAANPKLGVFAADVTRRTTLEAALFLISKQLGVPYGLINNAALDSPPDSPASENGPFEDYPEESWDKVMSVNAKGVFLSCQVFGKAMADNGGGSIANVASIYGTVSPDQALYQYRRDRGEVFFKPVAYCASKSALYNFTRYLAVYWGPKGVRANTLTFAGVYNGQDPEFLEQYSRKIPLRHSGREHLHSMATPGDYVGPAIFLMSNASAYMTGADLRIDGGFLAI
ncbi:SDR family oxidoreductase [Hyphomonas sp.]|uniref:SDR family oxidoreductase n=1 Tax=Hyphomonas sp. TaxID=87 RepID=UPI001BCDEA2F|nr:SDR family oxidoreductase [Hyphomonas sp.]